MRRAWLAGMRSLLAIPMASDVTLFPGRSMKASLSDSARTSIETVIPVRSGDIHPDVGIKGTSFGTVIGVVENPTSVTPIPGDIFCETSDGQPWQRKFASTFLRGNCTGSTCGRPWSDFDVRSDDCETVKALLAASVTSDPDQNLRWWLFTQLRQNGGAEFRSAVRLPRLCMGISPPEWGNDSRWNSP